MQSKALCYCKQIKKFNPHIDFVILIHPMELRRRIATGKMAFLNLENSHLILGQDYSDNDQVNEFLVDPNRYCVILYPGKNSINLSAISQIERVGLFPKAKKLTLFVIDGTWDTARQTMRLSKNLIHLPQISFVNENPSTFRVRKQPNSSCYSTIEAIYHTIELIGSSQGFDITTRAHDNLLHVFNKMVQTQLKFIEISEKKPNGLKYRRVRSS